MDNFLYKYIKYKEKYCLSGGAKDTIYCVTSDYKLVEIAKINENQDIIYMEYVNKLAESDKKIHNLLCKITYVHCYTSDGEIYDKNSYMKLTKPTYLSNVYKDINYYAIYKRSKCNILVFITDNIWYVYIHTHINHTRSAECIDEDKQNFINNYILSTLINMGIKYKNAEEKIINISDSIYTYTNNLEEKYKLIEKTYKLYIKLLDYKSTLYVEKFDINQIYTRDNRSFINAENISSSSEFDKSEIDTNSEYINFIQKRINSNNLTITTNIVVNIDPDTANYIKAYCCLIQKIDSCYIFVFFQFRYNKRNILLYVYSEETITKDSPTWNEIDNFLFKSSNDLYNINIINIFNHILAIHNKQFKTRRRIRPDPEINKLTPDPEINKLYEICYEAVADINNDIEKLNKLQPEYEIYKQSVYNDIPGKLLKLDKSKLKLEVNTANKL